MNIKSYDVIILKNDTKSSDTINCFFSSDTVLSMFVFLRSSSIPEYLKSLKRKVRSPTRVLGL